MKSKLKLDLKNLLKEKVEHGSITVKKVIEDINQTAREAIESGLTFDQDTLRNFSIDTIQNALEKNGISVSEVSDEEMQILSDNFVSQVKASGSFFDISSGFRGRYWSFYIPLTY